MDLSPLQYIILVLVVSTIVFLVQNILKKERCKNICKRQQTIKNISKMVADSQKYFKTAMEIKENILIECGLLSGNFKLDKPQ